MDFEIADAHSASANTIDKFNDNIHLTETANDYNYGMDTKMDKDPENFNDLSEFSNSVSFDLDDDEVKYEEGKDLINECPYCYTPFKKMVANLKGYQIILFIFVSMMLPFVVRFTFLSSYINYTESQPSLKSVNEGKILFLGGFVLSCLLLIGECFNGLKLIVDMIDKKKGNRAADQSDEVRLHRGCVVIKATKNGFPLWTTKNNKLAAKRPLSFLKWAYGLTISELVIHIVINLRWITSMSFFIGSFITTTVSAVVLARNVNDSVFYLFAMHLSNGIVSPLFIYYGLKLPITYIWSEIQSYKIAKKGHVMEEPLKTRTGKTLLTRPLFAFLSDSCPCNYAVDTSSQLPKLYKYSIRYHCVFNGVLKNTLVYLLCFYAVFNTVVSIMSLATKMNYISLYKI